MRLSRPAHRTNQPTGVASSTLAAPISMASAAVIDNAVYVDGHRVRSPASFDETLDCVRDSHGMAWVGLYRPDAAQLETIGRNFGLHPLAVEDAITAHQRPTLERYGDVLFAVLRPARYLDDQEQVEFGELHVFVGADFVVTVRHAEAPDLASVRRRLEANQQLLRLGPEAVLYAILDEIVDAYEPVITGLENDIGEIEDQLFNGDPAVSRRIYELSREVITFQRTARSLVPMLKSLEEGFGKYQIDVELQRNLRDVTDHVLRIVDRVDAFRALLENALSVNATLVAQRQNDEMRHLTQTSLTENQEVQRISAWAAILFAPTLVSSLYGMNFKRMPELYWTYGYPLSLLAMLVTGLVLYRDYRRNGVSGSTALRGRRSHHDRDTDWREPITRAGWSRGC